jgi:hypothetical protein
MPPRANVSPGHLDRGRILQKIGSEVMAEDRGLPYASRVMTIYNFHNRPTGRLNMDRKSGLALS